MSTGEHVSAAFRTDGRCVGGRFHAREFLVFGELAAMEVVGVDDGTWGCNRGHVGLSCMDCVALPRGAIRRRGSPGLGRSAPTSIPGLRRSAGGVGAGGGAKTSLRMVPAGIMAGM